MIKYLFDASAIVNLVKRGKLQVFAQGATLELARYEALNAVWKEHLLLQKLPVDVAREFVGILSDLFNAIEVLSITGNEPQIYALAVEERIPIYDAAYIYTAIRQNLTLVTDDKQLQKVAVRRTSVLCSRDLR